MGFSTAILQILSHDCLKKWALRTEQTIEQIGSDIDRLISHQLKPDEIESVSVKSNKTSLLKVDVVRA